MAINIATNHTLMIKEKRLVKRNLNLDTIFTVTLQ